MLAKLVVDQQEGSSDRGVEAPGGCGRGRPNDIDHVPANYLMFGRNRHEEHMPLHQGVLPKLSFPKFNGENPKIWIDKCGDYFRIFNVPECMWTTTTSLYMEENAAKRLQVYKLKSGLGDWPTFVEAVESKFGAYDYRIAIQDLLGLKQEGIVEDHTKEFEAIQFQVSMFNPGFDDLFFTSQFVTGLKDEIMGAVQAQLPDLVDKASMLARVQ
jgi:hypothetical protein